MAAPPRQPDPTIAPSPRLRGLDALRLLAIAAVSLQHALSLGGIVLESWWSPGNLGVGLFCIVAGVLAMRSHRSPRDWLARRLVRLYPAFWIATLAGFLAAWITAYKPFTAMQVLAQLSGMGFYLLGRDAMVNQATWFVSLILVCYVLALLARVSPSPRAFLLGGGAAGAAMTVAMGNALGPGFIALFCFAGALAEHRGVVATLALLGPVETPRVRRAAGWVYEYFLVHGIAMAGAAHFAPGHRGMAAATVGVVIALPAAAGLRRLAGWGVERLGLKMDPVG